MPGSLADEPLVAGIDDEPPVAPTEGVVVVAPPPVGIELPDEGVVQVSVVGIEDEPPVAPTDGVVAAAPPVVVVEPLFDGVVVVCARATLETAAAKVAAIMTLFIRPSRHP